jgi:hypothetical protein
MEVKSDKDYCFVVPIQPDRLVAVRDFWREAGTKKANTMDVYLRDVGYTRLMAFLETSLQGSYMTQYVRGSEDLRTEFLKSRNLNLPIADFVLRKFVDFAGYDFTAPENIPDLELLVDWESGKVRDEASEKHAVYAIKLMQSKADDVKRLYAEMKGRIPEIDQQTGGVILRVLSFLQHRPEGDYVVEYIRSTEDAERIAEKIMRSDQPALRQMKEAMSRLLEVDITKPGNMPKLELLFDWSAGMGIRVGEAAMAHHR